MLADQMSVSESASHSRMQQDAAGCSRMQQDAGGKFLDVSKLPAASRLAEASPPLWPVPW